jgi:hypothetical protein
MPTSLAQKEASRRWRLKNKDYFKTYQATHNIKKTPEQCHAYYEKNKDIIKFKKECKRLRTIEL